MRNILIIAFLLSFSLAFGSTKDFTVKRFGIDQDFLGIFIYDIIQDADGFLWIASDDGLYKFDGLKMTNFSKSDSTMDELVTATTVSRDAHLLFGYYSGGISTMEHGRYRKIVTSDSLSSKVSKMRLDDDGIVWAITQSGTIVSLDGDDFHSQQIDILSDAITNDFFFHQEYMYVASSKGLIRFIKKGRSFVLDTMVAGLDLIHVNTIYEDPNEDDVLWVGTSDGLYRLIHGSNLLDKDISVVEGTEHFNITSLAKDQLETLWVGTSFHGLVELDLIHNNVDKITYFNRSTGFPSDQIRKVYLDRENELWIGTFGNGLVQLNRAFFHHYELLKSSKIQQVNSIVQINEDLYFLGTSTGLVRAFNQPKKDSLNFELIDLGKNLQVTKLRFIHNRLWIGTKNQGLFEFDYRSGRLIEIAFDHYVGNHEIRDISEGTGNTVWLSVAGHGVYHLSQEGELLSHRDTRSGFFHNEVFSILVDKAENVWFASYGAGLALLPKGGEMQYLTRDGVFPARDINSLIQDESGIIWIATAGAGAYSYEGNEFTRFSQEDGLLSDFCNAIEVDNEGQVWIGHRKGMSLIQLEYGLIRRFNHPAELGETEAVLNAVSKDNRGNIWFGNPYGVTSVILPHIQHAIKDRDTHILDLRLFYDQVDLLDFSKQEKLDNILPNDLTFPYNKNHLSFDFVSVNLRDPQALYYRYMLDGFDNEWSPITTANEAVYSNLDPGTYTFKVTESDHPKLWSDSHQSITFTVKFPFWQAWWFYLGEILLMMSMVFITAYLSKHIQSLFWIRIMVYVSLFMIFEFIHTELEPFIESLAGEAPIFEVGLNLCLALCLLPLEWRLASYLKHKSSRKENLNQSKFSEA